MANFARSIGLRPYRQRITGTPTSMDSSWRNYGGYPFGDQEEYNERSKRRRGRGGGVDALMREMRQQKGQDFSQMMAVQKEENEQEKFYVGKWMDLISKARELGDMALQKHLLNMGEDFISRLSPGARALSETLLRSGPFDKNQQKMRKWDSMNPAPQITADPDAQPHLYAQQVFEQEDWRAQRTHAATGQAGAKRNLIPINGKDGIYAMRDDKGRASVVNEEMLQVKEFASQYGLKEGDVLANGGAYGKPIEVMVNGKLRKQRSFVSFPDNKVVLETLPGKTAEQLSKDEEQLAEFMAVYGSDNADLKKKHKIVSAVEEMEKSGMSFQEISETYLKPMYGMNFVKPKKEATIWSHLYDVVKPGDYVRNDGYVYGENTTVKYFPGDPTPLKIDNNMTKMVYYDDLSDTVYTPEGTRLGKPDQARATIIAEMKKLEKKKQLEEEMKLIEKENEEKKSSGIGISLMKNKLYSTEWY